MLPVGSSMTKNQVIRGCFSNTRSEKNKAHIL
jgi:hypothetical protein